MSKLIFNGGDPLPGCPENWDDAKAWTSKVNGDKNEFQEPRWRFDCGFKLDFDGPVVSVSSRFYPPKKYYGSKWDGIVYVFALDNQVCEKEFEADSLEELHKQVEEFTQGFYAILAAELTKYFTQ